MAFFTDLAKYPNSGLPATLSPDIISALNNNSVWMQGGTYDNWAQNGGPSAYSRYTPIQYFSDPNGNPAGSSGGDQYFEYHPAGQGPGEPYGVYDTSGKFTRGEIPGKDWLNNWTGVLGVASLGVGAAALAGAGYLGGAEAATAGAGAASSYTAAGAPVFGVVDEGAGAASLAGGAGGLTYGANGAPIFGVVDQQAGAASLAGGGAGGGVTGLSQGSDLDKFYNGSSLGGGASLGSPSIASQFMNLLQSGGLTSDFARQSLFSTGGVGFGGGFGGGSSALGYGQSLAQLYSGLEGRRKAKQLQAQLAQQGQQYQQVRDQTKLPTPDEVSQLPGFQTGLEAVRRSMASQGYQGSGNMMAALSKYGGDFYNQAVQQRLALAQTQGNLLQGQTGTITNQAGPVSGGMSSLALAANGIGGVANLARLFL